MDRGKLVIMCYHMNILQLNKKPTGKDPIIRLGLKIGNTPIQVIQSASPILYTDLNIFREFFKKPHSDFRKACFKKKVLPIHFRFICFSCIQLPLHRSIIWKTFPNFKNFNNLPQVCTHHWCSWQYNLSLYFMSSYVQDFTDAGYRMWSQQQIHQMLKPRQTWDKALVFAASSKWTPWSQVQNRNQPIHILSPKLLTNLDILPSVTPKVYSGSLQTSHQLKTNFWVA